MLYGLIRSIKNKTRTRKSHNLTNHITHLWLVAMNFTIRTKRFIRSMRTRRKFLFNIGLKLTNLTIRKFIIIPMTQINHLTNNLILLTKLPIHMSSYILAIILDIYVFIYKVKI